MNRYLIYFLFALSTIAACKKSNDSGNPPNTPPADSSDVKLSYGDSILYVKDGDDENVVLPQGNLKGRFTGFPEGIELDELTGAINVDKSETGLRYRITFIPDNALEDTVSTIVLLSGISYLDKVYYMDQGQITAHPIYNGRTDYALPGVNGESNFDEGGGCNGEGIAVNLKDGSIDLTKTVANGVFGDEPKNGAQKEVELRYRISDNSNKALNRLKVKLYFYETPDDIDQDLVAEMNQRQDLDMFIGLNPQPRFLAVYNGARNGTIRSSNATLGTAKPRPPCIFIVGRAQR